MARATGTDDEARFEQIYAAHHELILAYAMRRTETRDDAADIVADTFLTAWRRREQLPAGDAARLWLYGIARRVTANHTRGRRRYERLGARLLAEASAGGESGRQAGADLREAIADAFGRLRPEDREVLTLVAAEGLSPSEAAAVLGCGSTAARVRLHRARVRFARALNAAGVQV